MSPHLAALYHRQKRLAAASSSAAAAGEPGSLAQPPAHQAAATRAPTPEDDDEAVAAAAAAASASATADAVHCVDALLVKAGRGAGGFPLAIPACLVHQVREMMLPGAANASSSTATPSTRTTTPTPAITRADADGALETARRRREVRFVRLDGTGNDADVLVVRERDYDALVRRAMEAARSDEKAGVEADALRVLAEEVLPSCSDLFVCEAEVGKPGTDHALVVQTLCRLGFFTRKMDAPGARPAVWFTVPMLGNFVKELNNGRRALVRLVRRGAANRNELLRSKLPKRLKGSTIPVEWLVHDALGVGLLLARDTGLEGKKSMLVVPSVSVWT